MEPCTSICFKNENAYPVFCSVCLALLGTVIALHLSAGTLCFLDTDTNTAASSQKSLDTANASKLPASRRKEGNGKMGKSGRIVRAVGSATDST